MMIGWALTPRDVGAKRIREARIKSMVELLGTNVCIRPFNNSQQKASLLHVPPDQPIAKQFPTRSLALWRRAPVEMSPYPVASAFRPGSIAPPPHVSLQQHHFPERLELHVARCRILGPEAVEIHSR